jgi:Domain of unknown function (DUF3883)
MEKYWIANFDFEECLKYGLRNKLWMMQYQYSDAVGNVFQGDRPSAVTTNWRQVKEVQVGDFLVAYLSRKRRPNGFFAIGKVIAPRKKPNHIGIVEDYVSRKQSHEFSKGVIHYTDAIAFYEDLSDKWRPKDDTLSRYAQRIDVESWNLVCETGAPWLSEIDVGPSQQQRALFQIKKSWFSKIAKSLKDKLPTTGRKTNSRSRSKEEKSATYASEKEYSKGQGFQLDPKLRKAIEDHAMKEATTYFQSLGYEVVDVSARRPYDLECVKGKSKLFVEVKGTQSTGESVFLTAGEVTFAVKYADNMALFIFHSIAVDANGNTSGGVQNIRIPWNVNPKDLAPLSYKYHVH